jgi:rhodanese-related sulfurtransferase
MIQDSGDNPEFIILDVRSPEEYAAAHIEDSALVDIHTTDTWLAIVAALDKSYTYLIY